MPALECFIQLEWRDETCRSYDIILEMFFIFVEKGKTSYMTNIR